MKKENSTPFFEASLMVMAKIALSDGVVDDLEVVQIARTFGNLVGKEIGNEEVLEAVEKISIKSERLAQIVKDITVDINNNGREILVRSAILVSGAGGKIDLSEIIEIRVISDNSMLPNAYLREIWLKRGFH